MEASYLDCKTTQSPNNLIKSRDLNINLQSIVLLHHYIHPWSHLVSLLVPQGSSRREIVGGAWAGEYAIWESLPWGQIEILKRALLVVIEKWE